MNIFSQCLKIFFLFSNLFCSPPESVAQINWASGLSRVIHPNSDQFGELLQTHAKVFTAFYTENCVGCEEMKSEFMFAANAMKNDHTLVFAAFNCATYHGK